MCVSLPTMTQYDFTKASLQAMLDIQSVFWVCWLLMSLHIATWLASYIIQWFTVTFVVFLEWQLASVEVLRKFK